MVWCRCTSRTNSWYNQAYVAIAAVCVRRGDERGGDAGGANVGVEEEAAGAATAAAEEDEEEDEADAGGAEEDAGGGWSPVCADVPDSAGAAPEPLRRPLS